jgi:hypothetical protein
MGFGPKGAQEAQCSVRNGFGLEIEFKTIYQHRNPFDYMKTVFLSNLAEFRALDDFAEEMAVLLMEN